MDDITMELFNPVISNDLFYLQEVLMENPDIDVNEPVIGSMTALHVAAEKGYSSCVKVLLSAGANINHTDEHGCTALMNAVAADWPLVVVTLLQAECNVNISANNNMTALHLAARQGSPGVVQLLLSSGADPDMRNLEGKTPLGIAVELGHTKVTESLLLGCRQVDTRLVTSISFQQPLLCSLRKGKFLIALDLILNGYNGHVELYQYMTNLPQDLEFDSDTEKLNFKLLKTHYSYPMLLQESCRIVIRRAIKFDIWKKIHTLSLPITIQEYLCFRDKYSAPSLQTAKDVYCFFNDNAREIY